MKNVIIKSDTSRIVLYSMTGFLLLATLISGVVLTSSSTHADTERKNNVSVIINSACTITTGGGSYARLVSPGTTEEITGNGINVTCNDSNGYAIYAAGFSGDQYNTASSNKMLTADGLNTISTGTSGTSSYWAMKLAGSSNISTVPIIDNSFSDYHIIPSTYTKVSHYDGATLGTTSNSVTTPTYKVHVASDQPANTYVGKVKYLLVHPNNDNPIANMQNWTGCSSMSIGDSTYLIDTRDNQAYNITKFNDGKCWMTTNLNLAGGTALSATDTDVTSEYISGFSTSNNLTKTGDTLVLPASSTTGFDTDNYSYVYNSGKTGTDCSNPGCYSYYSWDAATLGSGRSITADNTDAPYSICPKGWHLPNTRTGTNSTADFRRLAIVLGGSASIYAYSTGTSPTGAEMFQALSSPNLAFLRAGNYNNSAFAGGGSTGVYWSATSSSDIRARSLNFNSTNVISANLNYRTTGFSVRCINNN